MDAVAVEVDSGLVVVLGGALGRRGARGSAHLAAVLRRFRSWLTLVEVFFGIITRQAIRRGSFDSVKQLVGAIRTFIDDWIDRCHPFTWTKTADEILPRATRKRDSDAGH